MYTGSWDWRLEQSPAGTVIGDNSYSLYNAYKMLRYVAVLCRLLLDYAKLGAADNALNCALSDAIANDHECYTSINTSLWEAIGANQRVYVRHGCI